MAKYGWRDGQIKTKKLTVSGKMPVQYIIPKTAAYSTGAVLTGGDFYTSSAAKTEIQCVAQPPYAMPLVVCANTAGTAGHNDYIRVGGYDASGKYIYENIVIKGTAAGTTCSNNAFAAVNYLKGYGQTSANTRVKTADVGIGYQTTVIGLPYPIDSNNDIITYAYDGAYATSAFQELTISSAYNTLTAPSMTNAKVVSVLFKSRVQE